MNRLLNSRLFLLNVNNCGIANQSLASFRVAKYLHLENKLRVYAVSSSATKTLKHSSGAKHTPTHRLLPHRQYSSNEWEDDPRKKQGDNNKPRSDDEDTAVPRVSFIYSYKFLFLFVTKHRELIKICLDSPSFFSGLKRAFFFVTDCLSKKDIDDLQDVVADELLAKIKAEPASIYSKSCGSTYAVKSSDLMFVTLTGLRPLENPKNGNRILAVETRFTFVKDLASKRLNFSDMVKNYALLRFANLVFVREVDGNGKPGRWLIDSLYFYTTDDWPGK